MPKLGSIWFGNLPCETSTGVTAKGLNVLTHYFPRFSGFDLSEIPQVASGGEPTIPREGCALTYLRARDMHVWEESTLMVAQTLLRIFPRPDNIVYTDRRWKEAVDAISVSKEPADRSGKKHPFDTPRRNVDETRFMSDT